MRLISIIYGLVLVIIISSNTLAFGPPDYLPNGAHPRIFLTPTVLSALKAKVATNDQDWLEVKASADALLKYNVPVYARDATYSNSINYSYQGSGWNGAAVTLGLAYKMTGNEAYAAKLKQLIDVMIAAGNAPIIVDSGYASRNVGVAMAYAYDWLYDYLDVTTKTNMITTINSYYTSYTTDSLWFARTGPAYNNYFGGHLLGFGLCAMATYGDNATAPAILSDIRTKWNNTIPAAFSTKGFAGGSVVESYNYGPGHFERLLMYAMALQTATGEDIYSSYGAKIATNLLYNLKPNRWQATDEGDFPGSYTGIMPSSLPIVLSGYTPGVAGDWMAFFYNNLAPTPSTDATNTIQKAGAVTRFLFKIPRTQTDYRLTQPLTYHSIGDDHIYARSDWTDNAVWSSYMAGNIRWTDHQSNAAGHIAIQRGSDYLLVNSGQWKGQSGLSGEPSDMSVVSAVTNTLFFYDLGEYMYTGGAYYGGQGSLFPDKNVVLAYEANSNFTYAKADHTNAYDKRIDNRNSTTRSLRNFYRNFVYLNPGTFVVYDRIKVLKDTYVKKLYWHLNKNGQPVSIDAKTTSSTVGNSKLFIKSVYPVTSTVTFAQDGAVATPTTPRVEIADSAASSDFNPLTVLIADTNLATMPPTELVQSLDGKMIGTYIKEANNPSVVMFSSSDNDVVGNVSYTLSALTGNAPSQYIVHLPPNTIYTVVRPVNSTVPQTYQLLVENDPAKGEVYKSTSQGVLTFLGGETPVSSATPPAAPTGAKQAP